jgi:hypothetical protein
VAACCSGSASTVFARSISQRTDECLDVVSCFFFTSHYNSFRTGLYFALAWFQSTWEEEMLEDSQHRFLTCSKRATSIARTWEVTKSFSLSNN